MDDIAAGSNYALKEEIRAYWTKRAETFDLSPGHGMANPAEREAWITLLGEFLAPADGLKVLELACGTGEISSLLAALGCEVTGLDFAEAMLARAKSKLAARGQRARLFMGDAENTLEPDARYDAVVCRHLVWTLIDPRAAFADWFRVLKPGGRLVIIDGDWVNIPFPGRVRAAIGAWAMRRLGIAKDHADIEAHRRIISRVHFRDGLTQERLGRMLGQSGFDAIHARPMRPIRRLQRRALGTVRGLAHGNHRDFILMARKPL